MSAKSLIFAVILTAATVQAKTWVVDAAGGTGYHFKTIAEAVMASSDGDTILVRAGNYSVGTTNVTKAVQILGVGTPMISNGSIVVSGLAANLWFAMKGFTFSFASVEVNNNKGVVVLENLTGTTNGRGLGVKANGAALVVCNSCTISIGGGGALQATNSTVIATDCTVVGSPGIRMKYGAIRGQPAGAFSQSNVSLCGGSFAGSSNLGNVGVRMTGGRLELNGSVRVSAGYYSPAIAMTGGLIRMDASAKLIPSTSYPKISGSHTLKNENFAAVSAKGAAPGGTIQINVKGITGHIVVPAIGLLVTPAPTIFGELFLHPSVFLTLGHVGKFDANGNYSWSIPVPNIASLRGIVGGAQAATTTTNAPMVFSSPSAFILY